MCICWTCVIRTLEQKLNCSQPQVPVNKHPETYPILKQTFKFAKSITVNCSSQTDETITKIVCPPLKITTTINNLSKPIMSSVPAVIKSSTQLKQNSYPPHLLLLFIQKKEKKQEEQKEKLRIEERDEKLRIEEQREKSRIEEREERLCFEQLRLDEQKRKDEFELEKLRIQTQSKLGADTSKESLLPTEVSHIIAREPDDKANSYEHVKDLLLKRFKLTPKKFRQLFVTHQKAPERTWIDFYHELNTYFNGWIDGLKIDNFNKLSDLIITDQLKRKTPFEFKEYYLDE
ncbi:homeotic protein female sterile [Trichonephila clavipes]|nr:homeotic protein female sterile [Trichonephila clavipes]